MVQIRNDARVARPAYDRSQVRAGIAHFGVGGFHRSHQAMYLDRLMNQGQALDWGVLAVGSLPQDRRIIDVLSDQSGLYTLVVTHADGRREPRIIGSVIEAVHAPDDATGLLSRLADPAIRIASLTITEGGYGLDDPSPVFGHLVDALALRRDRGVPPFTVMSCDNLPDNGVLTKETTCAVARRRDPALADWIEEHVAFPGSMVDRITPATTERDVRELAERFGVADRWPVVCEDYVQWVLEDRFTLGRPPFEEAGVQLVDDVASYELMKLRLLNAGHQVVAHLGRLAGYRYVHEVCQDQQFVELLEAYLQREAVPTLRPVPGVDVATYCHDVVRRFANPEIADTVARIRTDGSDRIPKFLLPVVRDNLRAGRDIGIAALTVAAWADSCATADDVTDRNREQLVAAARSGDELAFLGQDGVFGELGQDPRFRAAYTSALHALRSEGVRRTIDRSLHGRS